MEHLQISIFTLNASHSISMKVGFSVYNIWVIIKYEEISLKI